jgi:lipopolysaccharide export system permease protein
MKEDSELILKASDKFLHELIFVDRKDYFQNKQIDEFLSEANARLTTPLLNIVMALLAIVAVLGGDFNRQGYGRRIGIASASATVVLVVQLALQSAAAEDPMMNIAQWVLPILLIIILSWVYFGRGRNIGKRAPPTTGLLIPRREATA